MFKTKLVFSLFLLSLSSIQTRTPSIVESKVKSSDQQMIELKAMLKRWPFPVRSAIYTAVSAIPAGIFFAAVHEYCGLGKTTRSGMFGDFNLIVEIPLAMAAFIVFSGLLAGSNAVSKRIDARKVQAIVTLYARGQLKFDPSLEAILKDAAARYTSLSVSQKKLLLDLLRNEPTISAIKESFDTAAAVAK